jgi:hypothetical protein
MHNGQLSDRETDDFCIDDMTASDPSVCITFSTYNGIYRDYTVKKKVGSLQ